ncbi:MAG: enediyne biosynthesis protein, partial [Chloroflexia bacterium]
WTGMLPWGYTVDLNGNWDWIVPTVITCLGIRLNLMFTGRIFIAISWLVTFILLGVGRAYVLDTPIAAQLVVLTGIPMVLFTLYMITDPQTSPSKLRSQLCFGGGIAVAYTVLLALQVQYTMFFCVAFVCAVRGAYFGLLSLRQTDAPMVAAVNMGAPAVSGGASSR